MKHALLLVAVVAATPAAATTVDFTQPVLGLDHKPQTECKEPAPDKKSCLREGPITIGEIVGLALEKPAAPSGPMMGEQNVSPPIAEQAQAGALAFAVSAEKAPPIDLTAAQVKMIEDHVAKANFPSNWVLSVVKAVDPALAKKLAP